MRESMQSGTGERSKCLRPKRAPSSAARITRALALALAALACSLISALTTSHVPGSDTTLASAARTQEQKSGKRKQPQPKTKSRPARQRERKAPEPQPLYPLQANPLAGCSICHVDVEDEYTGSAHFKKKVGCKTCHGPSKGHVADENNEVKPDQTFARQEINRFCTSCHHHQQCCRPKPRKPQAKARPRSQVCTDCHGHHDLKLKKRKKPTRQQLEKKRKNTANGKAGQAASH